MITFFSSLFFGILGLCLGFFCGFILCDNNNLRAVLREYQFAQDDEDNRNRLEQLFDNPD